jgi:hypothetical protein
MGRLATGGWWLAVVVAVERTTIEEAMEKEEVSGHTPNNRAIWLSFEINHSYTLNTDSSTYVHEYIHDP